MNDVEVLCHFARQLESAVAGFYAEAIAALEGKAEDHWVTLLTALRTLHDQTVGSLQSPPAGTLTRKFDVDEQGRVFLERIVGLVSTAGEVEGRPVRGFDVDEQGSVFIDSCVEVGPSDVQGADTMTMTPTALVDYLLQIERALLAFWQEAVEAAGGRALKASWKAIVGERTDVVTKLEKLAMTE